MNVGIAAINMNKCLHVDKLFSHQILPHSFPTFSRVKLGLDDRFFMSRHFNQGVNVYGPDTHGKSFQTYIKRLKWTTYGIGEFHPQARLSSNSDYVAMFASHRHAGARYISPYFMSVEDLNLNESTDVTDMWIDEKNMKKGSDSLYRGIQHLMANF